MNVCEYAGRLEAYYDGELAPDERSALEEHLRHCAACNSELAGLRELSRVLAMAPAPAAAPGLAGRLLAGLKSPRDVEVVRICRIASMAAAALLIACGVFLWGTAPPSAVQVQAPPAWEVAAVTLSPELAQADWRETYALWVVDDLSRETGP